MYIFVTAALAVMIAGFGAGVALGLRMPPSDPTGPAARAENGGQQ